MATKTTFAPFFNKLREEVIGPIVDETMKTYFSTPPPNTMEPKQVWEQKTRKELMDIFSGQGLVNKTADGFDAIASDLKSHLSPQEMEKISEEWTHGVETWVQVNSKPKDKEKMPVSLQQLMKISDETLKKFYQAANRYFEHKDFQKASDAFYVIAWLDPRHYSAWLNVGLSEARLHRYEPALISFSLASILKPSVPFPYLYSAECCLKDHRKDEARLYLDLAKEAAEKGKLENKQEFLDAVRKLEQTIK